MERGRVPPAGPTDRRLAGRESINSDARLSFEQRNPGARIGNNTEPGSVD